MANTIKVKRSSVAGKVPTTGDLELGEIAVNTYDGKMYIEKNNGTASVVQIGDVVGAASATDNALVRFDGTTGKLVQNGIITQDDNGNLANVNAVGFDTTPGTLPTATGSMYWDSGNGSPSIVLDADVTLQLGQEQLCLVYNGSGSTITNGSVVAVTGAQGQRPSVSLADADSESTSANTLGIATEDIANGAEGFITTFGLVRGLNTSGFTAGNAIYLSQTAGQFTETRPSAPAHTVMLGWVIKVNASSGEVFVNINNGWELDELHNVLITSPTSGNTLVYDAAVGVWKNANITAGTGISVTNGAGSITIANTGVTSITGTASQITASASTGGVTLSLPSTINVNTSGNAGSATNLAGGAANKVPYQTGSGATAFVDAPTTANQVLSYNGSALVWAVGAGSGTVTSVAMTVPTGLSISGSPITTSGTLALTFAAGYSIPTTASQTNWDTAYSDRLKWDGGSTGLVASTGRTSLGATTLGSNLFTITNPGAITFPRFNADNTVSSLSAADFRTAIGAGTGSGTVTSVSGTAPISVATGTTTPAISISQATTSTNGYLSSTDWNTFNGKQAALVSGSNIKTVNSNSLLGSGNISVGTVTSIGITAGTGIAVSGSPVTSSGNITVSLASIAGSYYFDTFTATASQTTFTTSQPYTSGKIAVYKNGAKMRNGSDVTVTNGSTVVFAVACTSGDVIDVDYPATAIAGTNVFDVFTATASQTTFTTSATYTAGKISVYKNGAKMRNGSDVTVTSGTSVVFATACTAGDLIDVNYPI